VIENVDKVRVLYNEDKGRYHYVQDLANVDLEANKWVLVEDTPSEGLLWLKRFGII
jgi:hypothetical protein